ANSVRIREFVLTGEIKIQKDYDELTGLKNKSALTREINAFLEDPLTNHGTLFILDIDRFKSINDTYGHSVGDRVIHEVGAFLGSRFKDPVITGRFGGDEFIVFIKNTGDRVSASKTAEMIITEAREAVSLPDEGNRISLSIGIALYHGEEKDYSELFKKADIALYRAKADSGMRYDVF
ncbi:MAG: GGDEF domain-containing protein, partial [Lachnospiraceae bacterium]|nr:GGDEF domain-containing protein [Lachnospiraceae bacterium]